MCIGHTVIFFTDAAKQRDKYRKNVNIRAEKCVNGGRRREKTQCKALEYKEYKLKEMWLDLSVMKNLMRSILGKLSLLCNQGILYNEMV